MKLEKQELLSKYGQKQLLYYAQILDEISGYYTCNDPEIRFYTDRNQLWQDKLQAENGRIMERQLKEMSFFLKKMAGESYENSPLAQKYKKKIIKGLKENDLIVEELYVREYNNGRLEVGIFCHARQGDYYATKDLVDYISSLTHRTLLADGDSNPYIHGESTYVICREELNYHLFYNVAKATKTGEVVSGDNYLVQDYADGQYVILLSDGMGSGEEACEDSTVIVELADKLMEAGIPVREVVKQVNDVLCMRNRKLRTASLDLCQINLCSGEGTFIKCGATPTYVKGKDYVRKLETQSLPLGIMQGEKGGENTCYVEEGDLLVFVTDGVTDVFDESEKDGKDLLLSYLEKTELRKPKEIANQILGMAIKLDEGRIRDDMTVIVAVVVSSN